MFILQFSPSGAIRSAEAASERIFNNRSQAINGLQVTNNPPTQPYVRPVTDGDVFIRMRNFQSSLPSILNSFDRLMINNGFPR